MLVVNLIARHSLAESSNVPWYNKPGSSETLVFFEADPTKYLVPTVFYGNQEGGSNSL
jgi:hypothetical protein